MTKSQAKPAIAAVNDLFSQSPDGLRTFVRHLRWGALFAGALGASLWIDHPQSSMRLWSLTLILVCLTPSLIWLAQRQAERRRRPAVQAAKAVRPEPPLGAEPEAA